MNRAMTTTADKLAAALRDLYALVPFDGNHDDEKRKGAQLHAARAALADYDRNIQSQRETLAIAAAMLDHPEVRAIPFALSSTNIARALRGMSE